MYFFGSFIYCLFVSLCNVWPFENIILVIAQFKEGLSLMTFFKDVRKKRLLTRTKIEIKVFYFPNNSVRHESIQHNLVKV